MAHDKHSEKKEETFKFEITKTRIWQVVAGVLGIAVIYLIFFSGGKNSAPTQFPDLGGQAGDNAVPQRQDIDLDDDAVLGDPNAPVTIVSFEDYQCPYCGRAFQDTFPQIKKDYIDTGKVKMVFRDFPLSFHPEALPAAEAAECAGDQGKYWEYHDELFKNQQLLSSSLYPQLASQLGLDTAKFQQCLDSGKHTQEVQNDFAYGSQAGVSGTPTFFINGVMLVGAQPYSAFKQVIDAELASQ